MTVFSSGPLLLLLLAIGATNVAPLPMTVDVDATAVADTVTPAFGWMNGRVVGGQNAARHSAPWIVTLQWGINSPSQHCGGSILTPSWVLTAAHCLGGFTNFGQFFLIAGRHNLAAVETATEQRRNINRARTFSHPDYTTGLRVGPFDIGMIHVAPAFTFNAYVRAIALPAAGAMHSGLATLHGWGSTSRTNTPILPDILQTVTKPLLPFGQCQSVLGADSPLHPTNLCTGPLTGAASACSGDSGGPLVQNNQLIGVVSWGIVPCGSQGAPSVYVRTSAFRSWITATMQR